MNRYQRLRDMREDMDLKQINIADFLGISQTQYSKYELGKQMMGVDKYIKLAKFYNVSMDYLTGLIDRPRPLYTSPTREQVKNQQIIRNSKNITINNK